MQATQVSYTDRPQTPQPHHHWHYVWKKRLVTWARWLHIYLSMVSFGILFFFAVTGLTLNHQDWFAKQQRTVSYKGSLDHAWLRPPDGKEVAKLEIVEQLRRAHGIKAALSDFRIDDAQLSINFKGPGYTADTFVDRDTGAYEVSETRMGWGAIINDLHKGRDSGRVWGMLIDASAVLMTLVSFTGLVLIFFLARRRMSGLIALGAGGAVAYLLYVIFVP
jgi:hypothetical protein